MHSPTPLKRFTAVQRQPDSDLAQNHVFVGKNAFSDMFALKAIKLIGQSLETAYRDGTTRKARSDMMLGALSAGCAFAAAGTSLAHAIQYPIGAITKTAHGLGVATMRPFVMNYNRGYAIEAMCDIALALGLKQDTQRQNNFPSWQSQKPADFYRQSQFRPHSGSSVCRKIGSLGSPTNRWG